MGSPSCFFTLMQLLLSLLLFYSRVLLAHLPSSTRSLCHDDERFALLQFKESLIVNENPFNFMLNNPCDPKSASWKLEEGNIDCCSWNGVKCNEKTGYVIKLDLSTSCLYGFIDSSNSLFRLVHLEWLNLAFNNFNYSEIPSAIINFSELSYLNLSGSFFSGQIPLEILELSNLVSLDLSRNLGFGLQKPSLENLLEGLSNLNQLNLDQVIIASSIPHNLANLSSSLTSLSLQGCQLQGNIPSSIGNLTNLIHLDLSHNELMSELPASIGNLASLENLVLSYNHLSSELPTSIGNLASLKDLDLSFNRLSGELPTSITNLTQLHLLVLSLNKFSGELPASIGNIKSLEKMDVSCCNFSGQIPSSLSNLVQLSFLDLSLNDFNGTIDLNLLLLGLKNLYYLALSSNKLSLCTKAYVNATSHNLLTVRLRSCNITKFPNFLEHQHHLQELDLSSNKIQGKVPKWFLNARVQSMRYLNLSQNFLTGFDDQHPIFLSRSNDLFTLDLRFNNLQGLLPVPPTQTKYYLVSNNSLTGEIPRWVCKLNSLWVLDLSFNNLSGELPKCIGNVSDQLSVLQLRSNKFFGSIPLTFMNGSSLRMIDLNNNLFQGRIPRSLANCRMLEFLDLGNNQISDTFPSWLGALPNLNVLILHSNRLHGTMRKTEIVCGFPKLRIIDLSVNQLTGKLPSKHFHCWNSMKVVNKNRLNYMQEDILSPSIKVFKEEGFGYYDYSLTISNKGQMLEYEKISNILVAIILSGNKFDGEIPASIVNLKELQILDLANNNLQGHIPSSLSYLANLESLDLSNNHLSGHIPQKLTKLTFLVFFDVSNNNLTGLIPQENQFNIFENSSFDGNSGLCGKPLSKKCENESKVAENENIRDSDSPFAFDWIIVSLSCSSGLIVAMILWLNFSRGKWLIKKLGKSLKCNNNTLK